MTDRSPACEFLSSYREESAAGDLPGPGWALAAPYAAGPQTVLIPYPRLAALLSPQWFPQP